MGSLRAAGVDRLAGLADPMSRTRPSQSVDSATQDGYGDRPELAALVKEAEAFLYRR